MKTITKCRFVGYTFLIMATLVEIIMFCTMFSIDTQQWSKLLVIILTPIVFNASIWGVAIFYHKVKEAHTQ